MKGSQIWLDAKLFRQGSVSHIREYIITHQSRTSVIQRACKVAEESAVAAAAP